MSTPVRTTNPAATTLLEPSLATSRWLRPAPNAMPRATGISLKPAPNGVYPWTNWRYCVIPKMIPNRAKNPMEMAAAPSSGSVTTCSG